MKKKSLFSLLTGIFGIAFMVLAVALEGKVSNAVDGTLIGAGAGLAGLGFSMWRLFRREKKDPARWKQYEIESGDERNVMIRFRAKAAVGIFLSKIVLEMCLMVRYQKKM